MVAATTPLLRAYVAREQRLAIAGVPWKTYVLLRDAIDDPLLKMTYCDGVLELMSPSEEHEVNKKHVARLIELYAFVMRIPLAGFGSTTFRREAEARGVEPDESWRVERMITRGQYPHIVLEVIETSPLVDKLSVYDRFEVPEVWLFELGKLTIHRRKTKGGYAKARRSAYFPKLDPRLLERYAARDDDDARHEFAALVRARPKPKKK
jgi:Uma2 family endonuclease